MPPQQTNIIAETERDAAGLGPDIAIALAKDATDQALVAARLNASVAARDDALSEKDAAGPTDVSTRSVPGLLKRYWRAFQGWRERQRLRTALQDLSDRELMDIGLTRGEIDYITAQRAIDRLRDSATHLWSRGVI
ncbi:DUF1127 domain-containing protein [Bradyrhizobium sp. CB82]|uniref:DUF1127 domain-containing protein n=1 Tax=Bradyrhizobium sp. CB82 TaxID=3039159 RepID=UPI0024B271BB|nr:DUF1127 domain-containing protein [Bradyrhizobium sp. CB82]WFU43747.1 DUF1127 domain-containing protein [Bradyrhizobium sp. CB82]